MTPDPRQDEIRAMRALLARHLAELHRAQLTLAEDSRTLKRFTTAGDPLVEIELASEMLEQYLAASNAFLENMRGRFEARLALLRRGMGRSGWRFRGFARCCGGSGTRRRRSAPPAYPIACAKLARNPASDSPRAITTIRVPCGTTIRVPAGASARSSSTGGCGT